MANSHDSIEPVAWVRWDDEENYYDVRRTPPSQEAIDYLAKWNRPAWVPAYPHPPQQEKQEPHTEWLVCPNCNHKSPYSPIKAKTNEEDAKRVTKQARAAMALEKHEPRIDLGRYAGTYGGYTAPPKRQPLTEEEEMCDIAEKCGCASADWIDFARAIEAKLKEKNA